MFDGILTWAPLVALGRLTYSVYLVHLAVIIVSTGTARQPFYLSNYNVVSRMGSEPADAGSSLRTPVL